MVLLLLAWPAGHMMVPITEIWDSGGGGWGRGDFEFSFRWVDLELPEGLSWR